MKPYSGAGILFIATTASKQDYLLLARRKSGVWSIPGGGRSSQDRDAASNAWRETREEFGELPCTGHLLFVLRYPFSLIGFDWTTLVIALRSPPDQSLFPSPKARDFFSEFTEARWFCICDLPKRTHFLLYPIIFRLRLHRFLARSKTH